jgi:bifunctional non-homologous end joining protein LigD
LDGRSVSVSNLDKVLWPNEGYTKRDMLNYYRNIAPIRLPYLKDRPVTLRVFPRGIEGVSHYRRDLPAHAPRWFRRIDYQPETSARVTQLPVVDDAAGLIWLANQGSIEFHTWSVRIPHLDAPDQVIFDLDPGDKTTFAQVRQAALLLRQALQAVGLQGYLKTSGGHGLHVYVPLIPEYSFDAVHTWTKSLAEQLSHVHPDLFALPQGGTHRGDRVTLDYAQNSLARNTAAPYTLRARPGAPVSTPLSWEELEAGGVEPGDFTLPLIAARVQQQGDPFRRVLGPGQRLP